MSSWVMRVRDAYVHTGAWEWVETVTGTAYDEPCPEAGCASMTSRP